MTRPRAAIKQSDMRRVFVAARKAGVSVEIIIDGVVVRVIPETHRDIEAAPSSRKRPIQL